MVAVVLVLSLAKSKPSRVRLTHGWPFLLYTRSPLLLLRHIPSSATTTEKCLSRRVDTHSLTHTHTQKTQTSFAKSCIWWETHTDKNESEGGRKSSKRALCCFWPFSLKSKPNWKKTHSRKKREVDEKMREERVSSLGGQKRTTFRSFRRLGQWTVWLVYYWLREYARNCWQEDNSERERGRRMTLIFKKYTHDRPICENRCPDARGGGW
jgi:hypothetical protein